MLNAATDYYYFLGCLPLFLRGATTLRRLTAGTKRREVAATLGGAATKALLTITTSSRAVLLWAVYYYSWRGAIGANKKKGQTRKTAQPAWASLRPSQLYSTIFLRSLSNLVYWGKQKIFKDVTFATSL